MFCVVLLQLSQSIRLFRSCLTRGLPRHFNDVFSSVFLIFRLRIKRVAPIDGVLSRQLVRIRFVYVAVCVPYFRPFSPFSFSLVHSTYVWIIRSLRDRPVCLDLLQAFAVKCQWDCHLLDNF
jgi:hypothetical protein